MHPATGSGGQSLTVHQLLRQWAPDYWKRFGPAMPQRHREVFKKILSCRTPARGGQLFQCPDCPGFAYRYHSCNDRHCPQCGQTDADDWLARQRQRLLLPTPYFLVTFTVPEALRRFIRSHQRIALDLLFETSARALQDLAGNARRLGGQLGMLGVLHTWSRTLIYHPHVHYLIPGGALTPDGRRWVPATKFLLHHKALGARVCTLFKDALLKRHPGWFAQVPAAVWHAAWNVGCQRAGSGEQALRYLSRYVFKTATGNRKVAVLADGKVLWPYRESTTRKWTALKLEPLQFLSRFLQHILPRGLARVRTFGWLHPAAKLRANRVRALLRQKPLLTAAEKDTWQPPPDPPPGAGQEGIDPMAVKLLCTAPRCVRCHKPMRLLGSWHGAGAMPRPPP